MLSVIRSTWGDGYSDFFFVHTLKFRFLQRSCSKVTNWLDIGTFLLKIYQSLFDNPWENVDRVFA
jgi:hypothetical protein